MTDDVYAGGHAPPPGWLHDPSTAQTRWWDGSRWTDHVLPPQPGYGAVFGTDPRLGRTLTSKNGPAKASLILILVQLLGGLTVIAIGLAAGPQVLQYLWLFSILSLLGFLMTIAAFVLAIVGTGIAVRRPTRKREAVFALVLTSLAVSWLIARAAASIATYGAI
ncbi:DUF2510 domain-containing protein [Microbacterium trichothecenolyticum]|uniref:DUF2510 domain-containing protein n=1 Tax=Microbacterium trichothecenolyticum TaxID=69370 RepID=UPI001C6E42F7|nr:DUF2510 domain-containing protein [Microbacterium trichothecenolyticum]MBW9120588.1 DUF2510 domain-containing protein [Microbacterium trichothecenolyticum]